MKADGAGVARHLDTGLGHLALSLPASARAQLLQYVALLQKWNRVYNLVAVRQAARLVSHHLLDSLSALPHLPGSVLVDVGSGAGFPGIPLAIARPDWQIVLLDSNHKKGAFLRQAVIELELANATVVIARAEDWHSSQPGTVAVSRAFADLAGFAEAARHLVGPGGILAAMKGVYPHEELAQLPPGVRADAVVPLHTPERGAARHLVLLRVEQAGQ